MLYAELRWLMRLRWVAAVFVTAAGLSLCPFLDWSSRAAEIVVLGLLIALFNTGVWLVARLAPAIVTHARGVQIFATTQLYVDLLCLTLLVMWTGGADSVVLGLFVFHMIFAGLLQPRIRAFACAIIAIVMVCSALWYTKQFPDSRPERLALFSWGFAQLVAVYLADRISGHLYRHDLERDEAARQLEATLSRFKEQQDALIQSEKMVAMGQLAAGVAHEIINPLASMDGVLQLMQRNPSTPREESVGALREQIQRIQRIVNQLTSFAHAGKGTFEVMPINDVVQASLDMLALDRRIKRVQVSSELDAHAGSARVNRHALEQVLTNLYRNALDAMAERTDAKLVVRTQRLDGHCTIRVSDNGSGIAAEDLKHIFEPFFTTKPVGQGTGLGLSISSNLVREHTGRLEVESEPNAGTTFTVVIPVGDSRGSS